MGSSPERPAGHGEADWRLVANLQALRRAGRMLCRVVGRQVVLFDTPQGIVACNNRCPHEGYPLIEGTVDSACTLTCNWHNWKFDLTSGANLSGGDRLRTYPVRIRGDDILIDVADLPYEVRFQEALDSLRDAFDENAYDRIARELARLQSIGADPLDSLRRTILWSHDRMEFGWTHAFAGMADWLELYHEHAGDAVTRLSCLLESISHAADDVLREKAYPFPDTVVPYDEERFVEAIDAEEGDHALAMVRGGLAAGLLFPDFERGLSRAALLHYNDFGHSLIYVTKAARLVEQLGKGVAEPLLLSLVREIIFATREDLIPEFRRYADTLSQWGRTPPAGPPDRRMWRKLGVNEALETTLGVSGAEPEVLYHALLGANAANFLGFDIDHQEKVRVPVSANVGWLDFTHGITFASAVRQQCSKFPELWPQGLLQMTCFAGRNAAFTVADPDLNAWRVVDEKEFLDATIEKLFDHGVDEFIVSVHLLKTVLATREELRSGVPEDVAALLSAALNRFLTSRLKRKHVLRTVHQAVRFVARENGLRP